MDLVFEVIAMYRYGGHYSLGTAEEASLSVCVIVSASESLLRLIDALMAGIPDQSIGSGGFLR